MVSGLFFVSQPLTKDYITSPRSHRSDPGYLPWVERDYHPIGMPAMFVGQHGASISGLASRRI